MSDSLMAVARQPKVHAVIEDESKSDLQVAQYINSHLDVEVSEQEVRTYRKLLKPDFLRSSPYAEGTRPLPTAPAVRKNNDIPSWADAPGYSVEGDEGTIITAPRLVTSTDEGERDDAAELREFGFDPEIWEVAWAKRSNWQAANGDWLESRKLTVKKRDAHRLTLENVNEVFAAYAVPNSNAPHTKNRTVMLALGDTQAGKVDGGGSESLVARFARIINDVATWLRSTGGCERLVLVWAGDCIEGVVSQNGKLVSRLDLSVTEQVRLVSRMIMHEVGVLAPLCDKMLILSVPGNHDESHRVAATKPSDSWAIQAASSVADALDLMGGYEHVEWLFPLDQTNHLAVSVGTDEHPFVIGVTHGHTCRNVNNVVKWWEQQSLGRSPVGEADLLVTGHWHHLRTQFAGGGRTWVQLPSMDGGSSWFTEKTGTDSPAGAVTMIIDPSKAPGWSDLKVWS
jgi:predicted phosphodiesterase